DVVAVVDEERAVPAGPAGQAVGRGDVHRIVVERVPEVRVHAGGQVRAPARLHVVRPEVLAIEPGQVAAARARTVEPADALQHLRALAGADVHEPDVGGAAAEHVLEGVGPVVGLDGVAVALEDGDALLQVGPEPDHAAIPEVPGGQHGAPQVLLLLGLLLRHDAAVAGVPDLDVGGFLRRRPWRGAATVRGRSAAGGVGLGRGVIPGGADRGRGAVCGRPGLRLAGPDPEVEDGAILRPAGRGVLGHAHVFGEA